MTKGENLQTDVQNAVNNQIEREIYILMRKYQYFSSGQLLYYSNIYIILQWISFEELILRWGIIISISQKSN